MGLDQKIVRVNNNDLDKFYIANLNAIIAPYNSDLDHDYIHANATTYRELENLFDQALASNDSEAEVYKKRMHKLLGSDTKSDIWPYSESAIWWGRKENHIHQWVIDFQQLFYSRNIDNTNLDYILIDPDELLDDLGAALSDRERAPEIMPTRSGFFFGPTDYDDYYFDSLTVLYDVLADDKDLGYFNTHSYFYWSCW